MKVVIAHPLAAAETGTPLDGTADLDDTAATAYLRDGFARLPDQGKRKSRSSTTDAATSANTEGA